MCPTIAEVLESQIVKPQEIKARYKIEIHFGPDRSALNLSTCIMQIWESGKYFHGGGDNKMYWCGYLDCQKPIRSTAFAHYKVVCPACQRECFLDSATKKQQIAAAQLEGKGIGDLENMPIISGEKIMKLPVRKIAEVLTKIWRDLQGDADIYLKYHPRDIRFNLDDQAARIIDGLGKARGTRQMTIYPLKNILKDLSSGADLTTRFLSLITA